MNRNRKNPEDRFQTIDELRKALLETQCCPETGQEETTDKHVNMLMLFQRHQKKLLMFIDLLLIIGIIFFLFRKLTG